MSIHDINFISKKDLKILEEMHLASSDKKIADRIKAIILLNEGWTYNQIAKALLLDTRTIYRYREIYEQKGVDGFWDNNYKGGFCRLSPDQLSILKNELTENIYSDAKKISTYIYQQFGLEYSPNGLVPLLHKIGFSYKKTKAVPSKADPDRQKKFIRSYKNRLNSLKNDEKIYFSDAVHPTYNMMPDYAWLPKGQDVFIASNSGRQRLNILGAYSPNDKSRIIHSCHTVNQDSVIDLLKLIEKRNSNCSKIYVYMDNARCNYSRKVRRYLKKSKIKLLYLPSYSPNLNLIERLWRLMKRSVIGNCYYETFEQFTQACIQFLQRKDKQFLAQLDTLMTNNFQSFPMLSP
jgi:transposase